MNLEYTHTHTHTHTHTQTYFQNRKRLTDKENKLTKGKREEQIRRLVLTHTHTIIYKIDNQGVPVVAQWFKHPAYSL